VAAEGEGREAEEERGEVMTAFERLCLFTFLWIPMVCLIGICNVLEPLSAEWEWIAILLLAFIATLGVTDWIARRARSA